MIELNLLPRLQGREILDMQQDLVLEMRVTDTSGYTLITFERREKEVEQHRKR